MTHANPPLESNAARPSADPEATHRVVSSLPPWTWRDPSIPESLHWRSRFVEFGGLAIATVFFAATICAGARMLFLAEEHRLGLAMFAALAALGCGSTWLGCRVVKAIADWLERARALTRAPSALRSASDPSPHPPPRDSTC